MDKKYFDEGNVLVMSSESHTLRADFNAEGNWKGGYCIWFNGTYVHQTKTYPPFEAKLKLLIATYELQESEDWEL